MQKEARPLVPFVREGMINSAYPNVVLCAIVFTSPGRYEGFVRSLPQ
jgi:hypothetical protein